MKRLHVYFIFIIFLTFVSSAFSAQDRYVRIRHVEGEVTLYPGDGKRPSEVTVNTPVFDGDEIETGEGRLELAYRNGIIVRVGDGSAVRIESTYSPMTIELLGGTLFVDSQIVDSFRDELRVRAGDAEVFLIDEGNMRVDLGSEGGVRVTSLLGEAEVRAASGRVLLRPGERTYVDPGEPPERAQVYGESYDELDDWNQSRTERYARGNRYADDYVDEDIYYDAYDLDYHGTWRNYGEFGHVWFPSVSVGWRPYNDGRWIYGGGGWFWVSYEPWGWAPYHYGRWGWDPWLGWYWIPGSIFAPSWVSWYDYGGYIGWCPLNYWNRPIYYFDHRYGHPVQKQKTLGITDTWTFVKKQDLGVASIKRASLASSTVRSIRVEPTKIARTPTSQLVSYVLPTTVKSRAYVNDKTVIRQPDDIKSPVGIEHKEEIVRRPSSAGTSRPTSKPTENAPVKNRNWDGAKGSPAKDKPSGSRPSDSWKPTPKSGGKSSGSGSVKQHDYDQSNRIDKDAEFSRGLKRSEQAERHNRSYISPYYRETIERNREKDSQFERNGASTYKRDPDYDSREISPRYSEEAKKVFQRFEESRKHSESERGRSSEPSGDRDSGYRGNESSRDRDSGYKRNDSDSRRSESYKSPRDTRSSRSSGRESRPQKSHSQGSVKKKD